MTNQIFISYSKKDSDFAHKLADDLTAAGFKIWIDRAIGGGDLWRETIEKNLKAIREVIIVVSPISMDSQRVQHEGSLAYGWGKQLFPILIKPVESLPPWLEVYQWVDFVNTPHETAFEALVATLTPPNPIQDLLDQELFAFREAGDLIRETILQVIEEKRETLAIDEETEGLISLSHQAVDARRQREETKCFRAYSYDEIIQRDKVRLDIFWLKDESIEETENLPDPDVMAQKIVENLEAELMQFEAVADKLKEE